MRVEPGQRWRKPNCTYWVVEGVNPLKMVRLNSEDGSVVFDIRMDVLCDTWRLDRDVPGRRPEGF